jgi:hypothetical protein
MFSETDVARWKTGSQMMLDVLDLKVAKYRPGGRLPRQFSRQYLEQALIAIAEREGGKFIGFVRASVECDLLLWKNQINGLCEPETAETIKQMGISPIISALLINREFGIEAARWFLSVKGIFDNGVYSLGEFLSRLINGERGADIDLPQGTDEDLAAISKAIYQRDETELRDSIVTGAENWNRMILQDRGHSNCVGYLLGMAFIRLARELWLPRFKVDHFLIPLEILDFKEGEIVPLPFPDA